MSGNALSSLRRGPPWAPQGRRDHSRWASDLVSVLPAVYPKEHKWIYLCSAALPSAGLFHCPGPLASRASALADPRSGEPEAGMFTLPGDVNPINSGDGEEVQEGRPPLSKSIK